MLAHPRTSDLFTLSLHDALPICVRRPSSTMRRGATLEHPPTPQRSEEHTSELQSHLNLVCRLLLEKKKANRGTHEAQPLGSTAQHLAVLRQLLRDRAAARRDVDC